MVSYHGQNLIEMETDYYVNTYMYWTLTQATFKIMHPFKDTCYVPGLVLSDVFKIQIIVLM